MRLAAALVVILTTGLAVAWGEDKPRRPPERPGIVLEKWGVEIRSVRLTAAGYMIEFRYKVIDADKAATLFVRKTKPRLIHQQSGEIFIVPAPGKVGPLRNSDLPLAGRTYWMFFANPARYIKMGSRVTIEIGSFKIRNLVVE